MADQITAALSIKRETLLGLIGEERDRLQAEFDKAKAEYDEATAQAEAAVQKWIKGNAKDIARQAADAARRSHRDPGDEFNVTVTVTASPDLKVDVPEEPDSTELDRVKKDYKILDLAEEKTIEVQPGSGNFGQYVK